MSKNVKLHLYPLLLCLALASCSQIGNEKLVRDIEQFNKAVSTVQPGGEIVLADGIWTDVELIFKAKGLPEKRIELKAQTPGKVIITGQSNLRISGEHLVVSGLVFKNGSTPTQLNVQGNYYALIRSLLVP